MARTQRVPRIDPNSGEGREIGLDSREIPGGLNHLANPKTKHTQPKAPKTGEVAPPLREDMLHGVPAGPGEDRYAKPGEPGAALPHDEREHPGGLLHDIAEELLGGEHEHDEIEPDLDPIAVYVVEEPGKRNGKVRRELNISNLTVVGNAADEPTRVCSVDGGRVEVQLLNEDTTNDCRVASTRLQVESGGGFLLPHAATSYMRLQTQGELWAMGATTNAVKVSVVIVTEVPEGS